MNQSSTLRRLENILDKAAAKGDIKQKSGIVLLEAMEVDNQPQNIMDFYEVLNKAEEEARAIKNNSKIDRYIKVIEELHTVFILNHIWNTEWKVFADYIDSKNVLTTLDALANYFNNQNPKILLDESFINKLNKEFSSLLDEVNISNLSLELKSYLTKRIEEILKAIHKYSISGTAGLEKATKSFAIDLALAEKTIEERDKENPTYKRVRTWLVGLLLYITPSPYDIAGTVPTMYDFWIPKFEELAEGQKKINQITCEDQNIIDIFQKASNVFQRDIKKAIGGREIKALPPSTQDTQNSNY